MRVGLDARLVGYTRGGIARYVTELAAALQTTCPHVDLLTLHARKGQTMAGFAWTSLLTPPHHRFERWLLPIELARFRLDIAHFPDHVAPRRGRYRSVVTVHDLAFVRYPDTHTSDSLRYYRQFERSLRSADAIIAVSEQTCADLLAYLSQKPPYLATVYNGIGEQFRPKSTEMVSGEEAVVLDRYGLPDSFVLTVGTLSPRKNLLTLLEAVAILHSRGCPIDVAVVGEQGWLYDDVLARIQQLGLQRAVHLIGVVPEADLVHLYQAARVFVFPSRYEGFAFPPLEAMACGTPVVASRAGSIPEVLGNAAMLVQPMDAQEFANAIAQLLGDRAARDRLRTAGLAQAATFTWQRCARQTADVYAAVAAA